MCPLDSEQENLLKITPRKHFTSRVYNVMIYLAIKMEIKMLKKDNKKKTLKWYCSKQRSPIVGLVLGPLTVVSVSLDTPKHRKYRGKYYVCHCEICRDVKIKRKDKLLKSNGEVRDSCGCLSSRPDTLTFGDRLRPTRTTFLRIAQRHKRKEFQGEVISHEELDSIVRKPCFYCGVESDRTWVNKKSGTKLSFCGVDRLDSSKGYVSGNIVSSCKRCNVLKFDYTLESYFLHIKKIYFNMKKSKDVSLLLDSDILRD